MSFTDQKPRIATAEECSARWGGLPGGFLFRCNLCGHRFQPGDQWRWVYAGKRGVTNPTVCKSCDGRDVLDRWVERNNDAIKLYWWLIDPDDLLAWEKWAEKRESKVCHDSDSTSRKPGS